MLSPKRATLLGVPIDALTQAEALARLEGFLEADGQHHVATPNNEMLVEAHHNPQFRDVLCQTTLNLPDSTGLLLMARLRGHRLPARVTGTDTMQMLCALLDERHPVFFLGAAECVAERAAQELKKRNPRLTIAGTCSGSPQSQDADDIVQKINAAAPHLLLVAFGAPAQDLWIAEHLSKLTTVRVAMGVGGAFDFVAGVQKRAPRFMRTIGLEWAWRFAHEPKRWRRMWRAVVVFPALCLFDRSR
ncbi:WecB/TagA/CpsF family glycosyltransferase [Candidatus Peregrinibacteria bacterium]|nr:WecB/TagA/CpsF family glycosyltransferase [Candidatus Peregrinibacteria bacterium]